MDGVEATRTIEMAMPGVKMVGLSMYNDEQITRKMREAGAETFV